MITRKDLLHLRISRGLSTLSTVYCFAAVIAATYGVPTDWEILLILSAIALLVAYEKFRASTPLLVAVLVSDDWGSTLQQPIKSYPVTDAEREAFVQWAEEAVLIPAANTAHQALDALDAAIRSLDTARHEMMAAAQERQQCGTVMELRIFRIDRDAAMATNLNALQTLSRVRRSANNAICNYLEKWRILVGREPDGIGILAEKYGARDPMDALEILRNRRAATCPCRNWTVLIRPER